MAFHIQAHATDMRHSGVLHFCGKSFGNDDTQTCLSHYRLEEQALQRHEPYSYSALHVYPGVGPLCLPFSPKNAILWPRRLYNIFEMIKIKSKLNFNH